jgi:peroxiredoxin Q/BCP
VRRRFALACLALLAAAAAARAADPAPGDPAPEFALPGSDGRLHRLADHVGKRGVVLAWFPKAFTPG